MGVTISAVLKENSQNMPGNKSNVTIEVYATSTYGSYNNGAPQGTITFSGNKTGSETFTHSFAANKTTCIFINSYDINHSADGTAKVGVNVSFATGTNAGTVTCSYEFSLTPIPRASMPSINSGQFIPGGQLEILTNRKSYEYAHKFTAYCDSDTASGGTYSFGTLDTGVGPGFTWTIPENITQHFTTSLSTTVYLTCETYKNTVETQNYVGSNTISFGVYLSTADIPVFTSSSVTDGNGYLSTYGAFVQGKSNVIVNAAASSPDGTPITTYRAYLDGLQQEAATTPLTLGAPPIAGNREVGIRAIDQRGRSIRGTKAITVVEYYGVKVTADCFRASTSSATTSYDEGTYIRIHVTGSTCNVNNKGTNTATVVVKYKRNDTASWTTLNSANRGTSWDFWLTISGASASYLYDIEITATDKLNSKDVFTDTVGNAQPILDFKAGGKGVGILSLADREGIKTGGNIYMRPAQEMFGGGTLNIYYDEDGTPYLVCTLDSSFSSDLGRVSTRFSNLPVVIPRLFAGTVYAGDPITYSQAMTISRGSGVTVYLPLSTGNIDVDGGLYVNNGLYWPSGSSIGGNVRQTLYSGLAAQGSSPYVPNNIRYSVFIVHLAADNSSSNNGRNSAQPILAVRQSLDGKGSYIAGIGGCSSSNHLNQFTHAVYFQSTSSSYNYWRLVSCNMFNHNGGSNHDTDTDGAYVTKIEGLI